MSRIASNDDLVDAARVPDHDASDRDVPDFDVPGLIRRVRRVCDLNQLELAGRLGVSQSTIGRWETGAAEPTVSMFTTLVALAGWSLSVRDENAEAVRPMRPDGVRDAAGRRRPAHLDVKPRKPLPSSWGRKVVDRHAPGRVSRDADRRTTALVDDDHPTEQDIDDYVAAWRRGLEEWRREFAERVRAMQLAEDPKCEDPCHCLDGCFEVPGCLTTCECTCEPALFEPGGNRAGCVDRLEGGAECGPILVRSMVRERARLPSPPRRAR